MCDPNTKGSDRGDLESPLMSSTNSNSNDPPSPSPNEPNEPNVPNEYAVMEEEENIRKGTISSARFNILCTMVGGGSLSLPLAFHQGGNVLLAPILLLSMAGLVEYSVYLLIQGGLMSISPSSRLVNNGTVKGNVSYESMAMAAFGQNAKYASMALISTICFFSIIAYGVLLRDMLIPLTDYILPGNSSAMIDGKPTLAQNISMFLIILLVTPLCTLQNLTALEKVGACSMASVVTLACCIAYRSIQCNFTDAYADIRHGSWRDYMTLFPTSTDTSSATHEFLNALPIFVNVFMCHFNVLPVHNEFQNPTQGRVNRLFGTSIWGACFFYIFVGISGSMWGNCTESGAVEGNILLSFDEDDALLTLGRACLTLTVTFAFPMLVVPARDVFLRGMAEFSGGTTSAQDMENEGGSGRSNSLTAGTTTTTTSSSDNDLISNNLSEPLLPDEDEVDQLNVVEENSSPNAPSTLKRVVVSVAILWAGALITCLIKSVDIVWDILGGSLSLMMGFFIPCGSFIVLSRNRVTSMEEGNVSGEEEETGEDVKSDHRTKIAWILIVFFVPICLSTTGNAIFNIINGDS